MTTAPILQAVGTTKQYGKFVVLGGVDLRVMSGTVHSVIGPNGAGKITLFHMFIGIRMITSGTIVFDSHDVTRETDYQCIQRDTVCLFQVTSLFPGLPVCENPCLTALGTTPCYVLYGWRLPQDELACAGMVNRVLDRLELPRLTNTPATVLSYGQQHRLEVDMAPAANPRVIFLDESIPGMGVDDLPTTKALIRGLAQDRMVVLVEHNMGIAMDTSDMITIMQQGEVLIGGTPDVIRANPRMRAACLGNTITGGKV